MRTVDQQRSIFRSLMYGKKNRGRALTFPLSINGVNLQAGDRLEPSPNLMNIANFEYKAVPFRARFWRMTKVDRIIHESPILRILGVWLDKFAIDLLHTWHMGPI